MNATDFKIDTGRPILSEICHHHAHVGLGGKNGRCSAGEAGRHHNINPCRHDRPGGILVNLPVESGDNPAKGRQTVGVTSTQVGFDQRAADCRPARVRVFDHSRRRLIELEHESSSRIEIQQIRERQLLSLKHLRRAESDTRIGRVPGGWLMRVFAVPKISDLAEFEQELARKPVRIVRVRAFTRRAHSRREAREALFTRLDTLERGRDGGVVGRRVGEGLPGQCETKRKPRPTGAIQLGKHRFVVGRRHDDQYIGEVLGGRADERRPADVDLFDQRVEWQSGIAGCLHKGIEIDRNNVDEADAVTGEGRGSSGRLRRARMPPCTAGCSVFTRPSSISGTPVTSETLVTGTAAAARARAVPPVDTDVVSRAASARPNSTIPVLSETLSRARGMDCWRVSSCGQLTAIS